MMPWCMIPLLPVSYTHLECIHYASPPYTSQNAQDKVMELAQQICGYQGDLLVHVVPFTNLQLAIYQHADESYAITLMRRMMMRIATGLAEKRHAQAIATGESIGQVASQTLESMQAINEVTSTPIIRPVVCMDTVSYTHLDVYKRQLINKVLKRKKESSLVNTICMNKIPNKDF